jgi:glycolate oxidase iron-sulfur subunit
MQTNFTAEQLADPHVAHSEKILRTCVHCGFCTATCPTYSILGDELDSPRGRIYLMKNMLENDQPADEKTVKHIDRCLSCLSCMTTCPSGVHYMHLVDHARAHIENTYKRPWHDRLIRETLAFVLPYPNRFRLSLLAALFAKPFAPIMSRMGGPFARLGAMLSLAPTKVPARGPEPGASFAPEAAPAGRVALLSGCAQPVLNPGSTRPRLISDAQKHRGGSAQWRGLLRRAGPSHGQGRQIAGRRAPQCRCLDARSRGQAGSTRSSSPPQAAARRSRITATCCASIPAYAEKARTVSALACDITEYLERIDLGAPTQVSGLTLAYHSACSMQHGQKITTTPKTLLKAAGFTVKDVPQGHLCCGSAGTYNIMQPQIARQLRDRKVANIESTKPELIATGNIGCMTQIGTGTDIPIIHTVQLLELGLWRAHARRADRADARPRGEGSPARAKLDASGGVERALGFCGKQGRH